MRHLKPLFNHIPIIVAAVALALLIPLSALAAEFTADQITRITPVSAQAKAKIPKSDLVPTTNRITVKGADDRQDIVPQKTGPRREPISIIRLPRKGIVWLVIPSRKAYQERRVTPTGSTWTSVLGRMMRTGIDKVAGYDCVKYEKRFKEGGLQTTSTIWWSTRLAYPVKAISANSFVRTEIKLTNIRDHAVSASAFTVPKGFKKMKTPTGKPAPAPGGKKRR